MAGILLIMKRCIRRNLDTAPSHTGTDFSPLQQCQFIRSGSAKTGMSSCYLPYGLSHLFPSFLPHPLFFPSGGITEPNWSLSADREKQERIASAPAEAQWQRHLGFLLLDCLEQFWLQMYFYTHLPPLISMQLFQNHTGM